MYSKGKGETPACSRGDGETQTCSVQALQQFMESDEVLSDSFLWSKEQPHRVSMFTGFVRSVRKMAGAEPRIPTPSQVESGSGQMEHDLVRQMAEIRVNRKALHENADAVRCRCRHCSQAWGETNCDRLAGSAVLQ